MRKKLVRLAVDDFHDLVSVFEVAEGNFETLAILQDLERSTACHIKFQTPQRLYIYDLAESFMSEQGLLTLFRAITINKGLEIANSSRLHGC